MIERSQRMTEKEIVTQFFVKGYVEKDYDFIMGIVDEDYIDHSPANARSNRDAVNILKIVAGQFGSLKLEILDVFGENGMVAARIRYEGIHTGTCMNIPATGKKISFEALENFRIENGKIVESWGYWPDMEILEKLKS